MNLKISNNQIKIIRKMNPYLIGSTLFIFVVGFYFSLFDSPPDYIQGDSMRIMYVHVPFAWLSLFSYTILAASCILWFVTRNPIFNLFGKSIAPIGAIFTLIALVTGSIWGKPTWGVWWVWDARLTSMLILLIFYLAYILTWKYVKNFERANKISSIIGIIGLFNLPVIKYSVDWWNTLHQPSSITLTSAPTIHYTMLVPLIIMFLGMVVYSLIIFLMRYKTELMKLKLDKKNKK